MSTVNSKPYLWPYHGALHPASTAILVFSDVIESAENSPAIENLERFVELGRASGIRVLHSCGEAASPALAMQPGDLCVHPAGIRRLLWHRPRPRAEGHRRHGPPHRGLPIGARRRLHYAGGERPGVRVPAAHRLLLLAQQRNEGRRCQQRPDVRRNLRRRRHVEGRYRGTGSRDGISLTTNTKDSACSEAKKHDSD